MSSNQTHNPPQPSLPVPSFSQSSVASSNGMAFSQSQLGSFNASQSVASTPRGTPPPKGSSQQLPASFNYSKNPAHGPRASFGGFEEITNYGALIQYHDEFKPQIYRVLTLVFIFFYDVGIPPPC